MDEGGRFPVNRKGFETFTSNFQFWSAPGSVGRGLGALRADYKLERALGLQGAWRLLKVFQRNSEGGAQPSTSLPPHREARAGQAPKEEAVSLAFCPRCSS